MRALSGSRVAGVREHQCMVWLVWGEDSVQEVGLPAGMRGQTWVSLYGVRESGRNEGTLWQE